MAIVNGVVVVTLFATPMLLADARETKLKDMMRTAPASAIALLADGKSAELADVYTGRVDVSVMDDFDGGTSLTIYEFPHKGGRVSAYQRTADAPAVRCGDVVRLEGMRLGDTMAVSSASIVRRQAAGEGCGSVGNQETAVIIATFPGVTAPETRNSSIEGLLFGSSYLSGTSWYRDRSYGKVGLSGVVFGPYTLDRSYTCDESTQMQAAAIRAAGREIDFQRFRRYILIFPPISKCAFSGMSTLGCRDIQTSAGTVRGSWIWINYTSNHTGLLDLLNHELGHSLGVGHSRLLRFTEEALGADTFRSFVTEYGDLSATMGGGAYGDFAAAHKLEMGWLDVSTDVLEVDQDGDFLLAPLGTSTGVRALKVRRRLGSGEWLWIEYRRRDEQFLSLVPTATRVGYSGALVRRETPESGVVTHALDMSPGSLDEYAIDLGVSSSRDMELKVGSTWTDPHSDLTIRVHDATPEGLSISIRYEERCATAAVERVTISQDAQRVSIPVSAGEGCQWRAVSGRSWVVASAEPGAVQLEVEASQGELNRDGVVSIGRRVVSVKQRGTPREMRLLSLSPPVTDVPVNGWVPFVAMLHDDNGTDDMTAIQLLVMPPEGSSGTRCYFRYSAARPVVQFSEDGNVFRDHELGATGYSGSCGLQPSVIRVNSTDLMFRFLLLYTGPDGETVRLSLRAEDASGTAGPWVNAADVRITRQCRAVPTFDWVRFVAMGGESNLSVWVSESPCEWTVSSDADWIRVLGESGSSSGTFGYIVERNQSGETREGKIVVSGTPIRVTQYGGNEILPEFVTLQPNEAVVSAQPGYGVTYYRYSLGTEVPVVSQSDWLRVVLVPGSGGSMREVRYQFDPNPDPMPRRGTLSVGGQPFSVLQLGKPQ